MKNKNLGISKKMIVKIKKIYYKMNTNTVILALLVVLVVLSSYHIYAINKVCKNEAESEFYSEEFRKEDEEKREDFAPKPPTAKEQALAAARAKAAMAAKLAAAKFR